MRRAFYALDRTQQVAFRHAVSVTRDGRAPASIEQAWTGLEISGDVGRTHVLDLYDRVADRLALMPSADRTAIEAALFGRAAPVVERKPTPVGLPAVVSAWG